MSVESLAVVLQHAPFAGRDKLILVGIANHDGDGGAWPAIGTLARYANCSISSAKRSLAVLMDAGAITRDIQDGGTGRTPDWAKPNLYHIHVECPANCDKTRAHRPIDPKAPAESMLWINPGSTLDPGSVVEPRPGSVVEPRPGSVVEPRTIKQPSKNLKPLAGFGSTSPTEKKLKCWACGNLHAGKGSYCTGCSSRGFNTPIISCTVEDCGLTMRRVFPGQQTFTCKDH